MTADGPFREPPSPEQMSSFNAVVNEEQQMSSFDAVVNEEQQMSSFDAVVNEEQQNSPTPGNPSRSY